MTQRLWMPWRIAWRCSMGCRDNIRKEKTWRFTLMHSKQVRIATNESQLVLLYGSQQDLLQATHVMNLRASREKPPTPSKALNYCCNICMTINLTNVQKCFSCIKGVNPKIFHHQHHHQPQTGTFAFGINLHVLVQTGTEVLVAISASA